MKPNICISNAYNLDLKITDHNCIGLKISVPLDNYTFSGHDDAQTVVDFNQLKSNLSTELWDTVYNEECPSTAFTIFINILKSHINTCTREKPKPKIKKLNPWISNNLCRKIKSRNLLYKKVKKYPNNMTLQRKYKNMEKRVRELVENQKSVFYHNLFQDSRNNPRKQWRILNGLLGRPNSSFEIKSINTPDGSTASDSKSICDIINDFFIAVPEKIRPKCRVSYTRLNNNLIYDKNSPRTFFFTPVDRLEIIQLITNLKRTNSCGADGINTFMVKLIADDIASVLCYIINKSFELGMFPEELKLAVIVPVFKKGDRKDPNNYRPIALLSVFSKLYEKVLVKRMLNFLTKFEYFSDSQFGFRKNRNTEDALLSFLNVVTAQLDKGDSVAGMFVDLTKAFDLVNHTILLRKLENIGFRGCILEWFRSYLSGRRQCTKVNGTIGQISNVLDVGVPQGSVLGPLLFLVYINSLCNFPFRGKPVGFADDMAFVYSGANENEISIFVNEDMANLNMWLHLHSMVLSNKTKIMFFRLSSPSTNLNLNFPYHPITCDTITCTSNCFDIESVEEHKYLGLTLDYKLTWKPHIAYLKKTMYISLSKMHHLSKLAPKELLKAVYFSIVNSRLEYGLACWGSAYKKNLNPLMVAQKRIIRAVHKKKGLEHTLPLFQQSNILPLRHLYVYKVLRIFFLRSGNVAMRNISQYNLRRQFLLVVPRVHTEHGRRYFTTIAPILFNRLPVYIRESISSTHNFFKFLRLLKKWLLSGSDIEGLFQIIR